MRYKDLIAEKNFLKVRMRARQLMRYGADLVAIKYNEQELIFRTASGTFGKKVIWTQRVQITDALIQNILDKKKFRSVEDLIKYSDLKVDCNCPSDLFWGYKYIRWKKGAGLVKETRRPVVRNPYERGYLCKHTYLVLSLYPFWSKALARKFQSWAEKKVEEQDKKKFNKPALNTRTREQYQSEDEMLEQEIEQDVSLE